METLGEMTNLSPGASVQHVEHWSLHKNVKIPAWTEDQIDKVLLPLIAE
jgi:hypothetical protein